MELGLFAFAVVMACLAAGVVLYSLLAEAGEASEIAHRGWTRGHRRHHLLHGRR